MTDVTSDTVGHACDGRADGSTAVDCVGGVRMTTGRMVRSGSSRLGARGLALLAAIAMLATALVVPATTAQAADKPTLLSPGSEETVNHPAFSWTPVSGATGYRVTVTLEENNSLVDEVEVTSTVYTPTRTYLAATYRWWVTPLGAGERSSAALFTRAWLNPNGTRLKPVLTAPINGVAVPENQVLLQWGAVRGADYYQVQVSPDPAFRIGPRPTLTSVTPASGSTVGGTAVTLTGTQFSAPASVTFDGIPATSVVVVNSTTITAVTPASALLVTTPVDVVVTTSTGSSTLPGGFTYFPGADPGGGGGGGGGTAPPVDDDPPICETIRPALTPSLGASEKELPAEEVTPNSAFPPCDLKELVAMGVPLYWRVRAVDKVTVSQPQIGSETFDDLVFSAWSDQGVDGPPPADATFSFVPVAPLAGAGSLALPASLTFPPATPAGPEVFTDQPIMQWDPVPGAKSYIVVVGRDIDFTRVVYEAVTTNTRMLPTGVFTFETAGKSYYWYVLPCALSDGTGCAADRQAIGQVGRYGNFKIKTRPLVPPDVPATQPISPAFDAIVKVADAKSLVLRWADIYDVEATAGSVSANVPGRGLRWYQLQISTSSNFDGATDLITDATAYAPPAPLGVGTYHWRVRPIDPLLAPEPVDQQLNWYVDGKFTVFNPNAPTAPTNVKAKAGTSSVIVSWQPPSSNGGFPITGYKVTYRVKKAGVWGEWTTVDRGASARSYKVTGLTTGDVVEAYVAAINAEAQGPSSKTVSATIGAVPSKPRNLNAYAHKSKVELYWNPPKDKAGGITGYRIQYSKTGRGNWKKIAKNTGNSKRKYVWKKGNVGSRYSFRVAARNSVGWGPFTPGLRLEVLRLLPPRIW